MTKINLRDNLNASPVTSNVVEILSDERCTCVKHGASDHSQSIMKVIKIKADDGATRGKESKVIMYVVRRSDVVSQGIAQKASSHLYNMVAFVSAV